MWRPLSYQWIYYHSEYSEHSDYSDYSDHSENKKNQYNEKKETLNEFPFPVAGMGLEPMTFGL